MSSEEFTRLVLKNGRISLEEDQIQEVIRLLNALAKIEFDQYSEEKIKNNHG
jgi:hypothetical protein